MEAAVRILFVSSTHRTQSVVVYRVCVFHGHEHRLARSRGNPRIGPHPLSYPKLSGRVFGAVCARRAFKEREELEMLRSMTEEERLAWERRNPKAQKAQASKQKYKFLQKYYHKGAFFQEASDDKFGTQGSEEIYSRDYTEAVAEENLDKSILPKVSLRPPVLSCVLKDS